MDVQDNDRAVLGGVLKQPRHDGFPLLRLLRHRHVHLLLLFHSRRLLHDLAQATARSRRSGLHRSGSYEVRHGSASRLPSTPPSLAAVKRLGQFGHPIEPRDQLAFGGQKERPFVRTWNLDPQSSEVGTWLRLRC